jgi:hypothetical protein
LIGTVYLVVDDDDRSPIAAFSTPAAAWAYIDAMPEWQRPSSYDVDELSLDQPQPYMPEPKPQPVDPTAPVLNAALTKMSIAYLQDRFASPWIMPAPAPKPK